MRNSYPHKVTTQRTLVVIKPDGVARNLVGEVLGRIERKGYQLTALKMVNPTAELLDEHYAEHLNKAFYPGLREYMTEGPVVVAVVEGDEVIAAVRNLAGATKPTEAHPGTIRGDLARVEGDGPIRNIIHGSDSPESAEREIALWFGDEVRP